MKTYLVMLVVIIFSPVLFAEIGLFELELGMSRFVAEEILLEKSFVEEDSDDYWIEYSCEVFPELEKLVLTYDPETNEITEYYCRIKADKDEVIEEILNVVETMHGRFEDYDSTNDVLTWFLEYDTVLEVYRDYEDYLVVEYYSE